MMDAWSTLAPLRWLIDRYKERLLPPEQLRQLKLEVLNKLDEAQAELMQHGMNPIVFTKYNIAGSFAERNLKGSLLKEVKGLCDEVEDVFLNEGRQGNLEILQKIKLINHNIMFSKYLPK